MKKIITMAALTASILVTGVSANEILTFKPEIASGVKNEQAYIGASNQLSVNLFEIASIDLKTDVRKYFEDKTEGEGRLGITHFWGKYVTIQAGMGDSLYFKTVKNKIIDGYSSESFGYLNLGLNYGDFKESYDVKVGTDKKGGSYKLSYEFMKDVSVFGKFEYSELSKSANVSGEDKVYRDYSVGVNYSF